MHLLSELDAFDGKHTEVLESLLRRLRPEPDAEIIAPEIIDELCSITEESEPRLQSAATWILKRLNDSGHEFSPTHAVRILELVGQVSTWEPQVHLLQIATTLAVPPRRAGGLSRTLLTLTDDSNKFVRAWAWGGLIELADQHEEYRDDVRTRVLAAQEEAPASVKARIRNAVKGKRWMVERG